MTYTLNNKTIRIPDADLEKSMTTLDLTKEEAIQMWLEDEGYLENEEQTALEVKAKENKINLGAKAERKTSVKKPRERKPDEFKDSFIENLTDFLHEIGYSDAKIIIVGKKVEFSAENETYTLDLVRKRKKKE